MDILPIIAGGTLTILRPLKEKESGIQTKAKEEQRVKEKEQEKANRKVEEATTISQHLTHPTQPTNEWQTWDRTADIKDESETPNW
jgi:hypothetical protein